MSYKIYNGNSLTRFMFPSSLLMPNSTKSNLSIMVQRKKSLGGENFSFSGKKKRLPDVDLSASISVFMSIFGIQYFFPIIAMTFFALSAYGFHRTNMRAPVPLEEQTDHIVLPTTRPTPLSLAITEEGHAIMKEMEKDA